MEVHQCQGIAVRRNIGAGQASFFAIDPKNGRRRVTTWKEAALAQSLVVKYG